MEFNMYIWDNADSLISVLNAIKGIFNNGNVQLAMKTFLMLTGIFVIARAFVSGRDVFTPFITFLFGSLILLYTFTNVKAKLNIIDARDVGGAPGVVEDVPLPIAVMGHFFSSFEKVLMDVISDKFQTANGINYNNAGYNYGAALFSSLPKLKLKDPYLVRSLNQFIADCVYEDILRKNKNFEDMYNTNSLWRYMQPSSTVGTMITVYYNESNPSGENVTCRTSYNRLNTALNNISSGTFDSLLSSLTGITNSSTMIPAAFQDFLGQSSFNSAQDVFKNTISARYIYSTLEYSAMDSLVSGEIGPYAQQIARNNIFKGWETSGNLAREFVPVIKSIIQLFLFAMYPLLLMLIVTPLWKTYLKMFLLLVFWLSLWDPLYAMLTYVAHLRLENLLAGVSNGTGYSMATMPLLFEQAVAHISVWNYFAVLVPVLALALAKGSEFAVYGLANSLVGSISSVGSSIGSATASPQTAGVMMGGAREIATFGGEGTFQRTHAESFAKALESRGHGFSTLALESINPGVVENSVKSKTTGNIIKDSTIGENAPMVSFFNAVREIGGAKNVEGQIKSAGDTQSFLNSLFEKGKIDHKDRESIISAIDTIFGDGDGTLSKEEIGKYFDFASDSKNVDLSEKIGKLDSLVQAGNIKDGENFGKELSKMASIIGLGEGFWKTLRGFRSKGEWDAVINTFGEGREGLKNFSDLYKKMSTMEFGSNQAKIDKFLDLAKGFGLKGTNTELLSKVGKIFGITDAEQKTYSAEKWQGFINQFTDENGNTDYSEAFNAAVEQGFVSAQEAKSLMSVVDTLGDDAGKIIQEGKAGQFLSNIVHGMKNQKVIEALGGGENGVKRLAKILAGKETLSASETEGFINKLTEGYKKEGLSEVDALLKAGADFGEVYGAEKSGVLDVLSKIGKNKALEMYKRGAFGGEVKKIAEGLKNKALLETLGGGNVQRGIKRFADIMSGKERMDVVKNAGVIDTLADKYMKEKGIRDKDKALDLAAEDLGLVEGKQLSASANLAKYADKLEESYTSNRMKQFAADYGSYLQSGGSMENLYNYFVDKGRIDTASAIYQHGLIDELTKFGMERETAAQIIAGLKETGSLFHSTTSVLGLAGLPLIARKIFNKYGNKGRGTSTGQKPGGTPTGQKPGGTPTGQKPAGTPTGQKPAGTPTGKKTETQVAEKQGTSKTPDSNSGEKVKTSDGKVPEGKEKIAKVDKMKDVLGKGELPEEKDAKILREAVGDVLNKKIPEGTEKEKFKNILDKMKELEGEFKDSNKLSEAEKKKLAADYMKNVEKLEEIAGKYLDKEDFKAIEKKVGKNLGENALKILKQAGKFGFKGLKAGFTVGKLVTPAGIAMLGLETLVETVTGVDPVDAAVETVEKVYEKAAKEIENRGKTQETENIDNAATDEIVNRRTKVSSQGESSQNAKETGIRNKKAPRAKEIREEIINILKEKGVIDGNLKERNMNMYNSGNGVTQVEGYVVSDLGKTEFNFSIEEEGEERFIEGDVDTEDGRFLSFSKNFKLNPENKQKNKINSNEKQNENNWNN